MDFVFNGSDRGLLLLVQVYETLFRVSTFFLAFLVLLLYSLMPNRNPFRVLVLSFASSIGIMYKECSCMEFCFLKVNFDCGSSLLRGFGRVNVKVSCVSQVL